MSNQPAQGLSATVAVNLPYLRRYARALTGNQTSGDRYAMAVLEAVLTDPAMIEEYDEAKVSLFAILHKLWISTGEPIDEADQGISAAAQAHLAKLTPNSREVLLLHSLEGFTLGQVGQIIHADEVQVQELLDRAMAEMASTIRGRVMVIEDEAIIAMDLVAIVESMGHDVTGVARTRDEAVALAAEQRPDLVLADIQLADNSSGVDAVNDILNKLPELPVIFITAFPERLLTGERPEPAFLINKPYSEDQVRSSVSQAMFFSSTETLQA